MKRCFLYPGQGSQYPGMGRDIWENSDKVKDLFNLASDICGMDMKSLVFDSSEEDLARTDRTQPGISLVNMAVRLVLQERGITSDGCAGFSLGEFPALADARVISIEDLFKIVTKRGALMQAAADSRGTGSDAPGMAAVVGLASEALETAIQGIDGIYAANYNSSSQIVVAGTATGLASAEQVCKAAGAKRYIRLKVSAPFHTPLLDDARVGLAELLETVTFNDPVKNVYSNVTGSLIKNGDEAKELALSQVIKPVRWIREQQSILDDGYDQVIETGPGKVLAGLWRSVARDPSCQACGTWEQIQGI